MSNKILEFYNKWYEEHKKHKPTNNEDNTQYKGRIRIPKNHYICGMVCDEVYKEPNLRRKKIELFELDQRFNTPRTVVYKISLIFDDVFIIGIRGTNVNSIVDLASDALVLIGQEKLSIRKYEQTKYVENIVNTLQNEGYRLNQSYLTGHSLGALVCAYIMMVIPEINGVGFNTGTSPLQVAQITRTIPNIFTPILNGVANTSRFVNYHMKGDILSVSSTYIFLDTITLKPFPEPSSTFQAHRMSYILQETQPNPDFNFNFN